MTAHEDDFYREEAAYWKSVADVYEKFLTEFQSRVSKCSAALPPMPPEPPVGTRYRDKSGDTGWSREVDGWYCSRGNGCKNCPVDWVEVNEYLRPEWDRELGGIDADGQE